MGADHSTVTPSVLLWLSGGGLILTEAYRFRFEGRVRVYFGWRQKLARHEGESKSQGEGESGSGCNEHRVIPVEMQDFGTYQHHALPYFPLRCASMCAAAATLELGYRPRLHGEVAGHRRPQPGGVLPEDTIGWTKPLIQPLRTTTRETVPNRSDSTSSKISEIDPRSLAEELSAQALRCSALGSRAARRPPPPSRRCASPRLGAAMEPAIRQTAAAPFLGARAVVVHGGDAEEVDRARGEHRLARSLLVPPLAATAGPWCRQCLGRCRPPGRPPIARREEKEAPKLLEAGCPTPPSSGPDMKSR